MNKEEVRICIENWRDLKRRMVAMAGNASGLPSPDYIDVFGWSVFHDDRVVFYYHAVCGASDKTKDGVVVCKLEDLT